MTSMTHWTHNGKDIDDISKVPAGMTHFVYVITNTIHNKYYIGQKALYSKAKYQVNKKNSSGKKTRRVLRESNWKTYYGSSGQLTEDIIHLGQDAFKREIVEWCEGKAVANYLELQWQLQNNALLSPNYYNGIINVRISQNQLKNSKQLQALII